MTQMHDPAQPEGPPGRPPWPGDPARAGAPFPPGFPPEFPPLPPLPRWPPPPPAPPGRPPSAPARVWLDPGDWPGHVAERLLEQRVVMAHGFLDDEAATLLCAQLLTVDADSADRDSPIWLHLQNLDADLAAALTVMDAIDSTGADVYAVASGHLRGAALGVFAASHRRYAYPNASFALAEPRATIEGTAAEVATRQRALDAMLDALYIRLAEVTGREVDEIKSDARRGRFLGAAEAAEYGLVQEVGPARR